MASFLTFEYFRSFNILLIIIVLLLCKHSLSDSHDFDTDSKETKQLDPLMSFSREIEAEHYPYIVGILFMLTPSGREVCMGSMISALHVLTAARCGNSSNTAHVSIFKFLFSNNYFNDLSHWLKKSNLNPKCLIGK